ncbi:type II toxin-antitoxin system RelE/ParE family toxin [Rhodopirellula sp. JC737]|nr:type II toxin-antitoxin system RelE/ParE family toxin [Rhodopirellula sp. JC737]
MLMQVSWTECAAEDLIAIREYIGRDSMQFAELIFDRIIEQTELLLQYPDAGSIVSEFGREDVSEIQVYSYRIVHQILPHEVRVLTVAHSAAPSGPSIAEGETVEAFRNGVAV